MRIRSSGSAMPAHGIENAVLGDLHGMVHDLVEDFVFALEVMVEATFAELQRRGDIVHGSGIVAALLEQASGGAQDFLPGIEHGLAGHRPDMVNS